MFLETTVLPEQLALQVGLSCRVGVRFGVGLECCFGSGRWRITIKYDVTRTLCAPTFFSDRFLTIARRRHSRSSASVTAKCMMAW